MFASAARHPRGVLRFGKLLMEDADLEIVGDQTKGLFCFFLRSGQSSSTICFSSYFLPNAFHQVRFRKPEGGSRGWRSRATNGSRF